MRGQTCGWSAEVDLDSRRRQTCRPDCHGQPANFGRDKASTKFDGYSQTLLAWDGSWTYEDLNIFLAGPTLTTPGVNMDVRGAPDETDRLNVIAYLRTLTDSPVPLP